jgi:hypothetical protein
MSFEFSDTSQLDGLVTPGERLGSVIDASPENGCQFVSIEMPAESGRKPDDQVLIVIEQGGHTPFVMLATDKKVTAWAVAGTGYAIFQRMESGSYMVLPMYGNKPVALEFSEGDTFGFVNAGEGLFVVRDAFDPHFEETDEAKPPGQVGELLLCLRGLTRAPGLRQT